MSHRSVFLVGMMGAGKSTVGRALAKRLNWEFIDLDHEIEAVTGVRIPVIFEIEGESGFRKRESQVLADVVLRPRLILATGGGVVIDPENRALLKANGDVIYLRASAEDLYQRTRNDKSRPLLQTDNPRQKIQELLNIREALYDEVANCKVNTGRQPVSQIAHHIISSLALSANDNGPNSHEH